MNASRTSRVVADISMSLDGFVTGPNAGPANGLGDGGEALHTWAIDGDDVDRAVLTEATARSGAVMMGRRLFDIVDGPDGWNDEMGYGADLALTPPFFVLTHRPPAEVRLDLSFAFVTEGPAAAVAQAREAAARRDVVVMGGGSVVAQCLDAGLLDELHLHVAPIVLGGGTPLFAGVGRRPLALRAGETRITPQATHLVYDVLP